MNRECFKQAWKQCVYNTMDDRTQRSRRQARQSAPSAAATGSNLGDAQAGVGVRSSTSSSEKRSPFYVSAAMTLAASQSLPAVLNDPNKGMIQSKLLNLGIHLCTRCCICLWNCGCNCSNFQFRKAEGLLHSFLG